MKLQSITEAEIDRIAEAFADSSYESGEDGLFYLFPSRESVFTYMRAFVRAGARCGWLYTTGENREAYIMISDSRTAPPAGALLEVIRGCWKALGLRGCFAFVRALGQGGPSLEKRLSRKKQAFLKIEMLAVCKPYQGQGFMRRAVDIAFQMGRERGLPCILDTDGRLKRDKYLHLGMELAGTRRIGPNAYLYDLIKPA